MEVKVVPLVNVTVSKTLAPPVTFIAVAVALRLNASSEFRLPAFTSFIALLTVITLAPPAMPEVKTFVAVLTLLRSRVCLLLR